MGFSFFPDSLPKWALYRRAIPLPHSDLGMNGWDELARAARSCRNYWGEGGWLGDIGGWDRGGRSPPAVGARSARRLGLRKLPPRAGGTGQKTRVKLYYDTLAHKILHDTYILPIPRPFHATDYIFLSKIQKKPPDSLDFL